MWTQVGPVQDVGPDWRWSVWMRVGEVGEVRCGELRAGRIGQRSWHRVPSPQLNRTL
jgi:hypothetical protein